MIPAAAPPLAILAGGGEFPLLVGQAALAAGRQLVVIAIDGEAAPEVAALPHVWVRRGQLGRLFEVLRERQIGELVMIGGIRQRRLPHWNEVDLGGLCLVLRHVGLLWRGDDSVLRRIARIIETSGVRIIGAADVAPSLTVASGCPTAVAPMSSDWHDITIGWAAAKALGAADKGQGVIACDGRVALREDAAGTDVMLERHRQSRQADLTGAPRGVLVKCLKPYQDRRFDMPAIGPTTVIMAERAGLRGIAVEAGNTLVSDLPAVVRALDERGLFLVGLTDADCPPADQPPLAGTGPHCGVPSCRT